MATNKNSEQLKPDSFEGLDAANEALGQITGLIGVKLAVVAIDMLDHLEENARPIIPRQKTRHGSVCCSGPSPIWSRALARQFLKNPLPSHSSVMRRGEYLRKLHITTRLLRSIQQSQ
jgi:hypothetical protein